MASGGGPWGKGKGPERGNGNDQEPDRSRPSGGRAPTGDTHGVEVDEIFRKGQERLRVLMGGRGPGGPTGRNGGGSSMSEGPSPKQVFVLVILGLGLLWLWVSFYTVQQQERSVELFLGKFSSIGNPGLNFAPWPLVTAEVVEVTNERQTDIGAARGPEEGLMLTRDQNIADIGFQVVWNISDPTQYLFNLADPADTIRAVSESAMRDIIARSELAPILNRDRGTIAEDVQEQIQQTLDSYNAGLNVIRVNFERADPPREVIDAFREVQAAQQERDRLEKEADAYANRVTAGARGEAARLLEDAEAYRARVVNDAKGEASRFSAVYEEYLKAPGVTRKRMYLESIEGVLGQMNKVILDNDQLGDTTGYGNTQGAIPFLNLNDLVRQTAKQRGN